MPQLSTDTLAAYAALFDFRTQIVKAARQILAAGGIEAVGPGEGVQKIPRYCTTVDFQRGAATGVKMPVALGAWRYSEYSQYLGTLSIMNTVPMETDEKSGSAYLTEDHARELDRLTSTEDALFMEHLNPFTPTLLPKLEILELLPIEPDERPIELREVNAAYRRWRVKLNILRSAWPTT